MTEENVTWMPARDAYRQLLISPNTWSMMRVEMPDDVAQVRSRSGRPEDGERSNGRYFAEDDIELIDRIKTICRIRCNAAIAVFAAIRRGEFPMPDEWGTDDA